MSEQDRREFENIINDLSSIRFLIKQEHYKEALKVAENSQQSVLKHISKPHPS